MGRNGMGYTKSSWSPKPRGDHERIHNSAAMAKQAPGFRFNPTEEELVCFYLRNKLNGVRLGNMERVIPVADVHTLNPWQLPEAHSGELSVREPWFYFCPQQERKARGGRSSRTTPSGYWKAAGTPALVYAAAGHPIGMKKTMVFYRGRAPGGAKTEWKLNEYRALAEEGDCAAAHAGVPVPPSLNLQTRNEFTLCRLYTKSGSTRQFDRRPSAAAAADGGSENLAAAAALVNRLNKEETGWWKRRRADTSSSDGDGDTQQRLRQKGTDWGLIDDMADLSEVIDN
ncbi:unnamed protein product [Urochloa decumbens]|uniref:NAC domain-containing protein n=1 Tax=Urochloa decumbens TaxID=240449 RepID=A0ABC9ECR7_9POAL